jgi:hypothetical protein
MRAMKMANKYAVLLSSVLAIGAIQAGINTLISRQSAKRLDTPLRDQFVSCATAAVRARSQNPKNVSVTKDKDGDVWIVDWDQRDFDPQEGIFNITKVLVPGEDEYYIYSRESRDKEGVSIARRKDERKGITNSYYLEKKSQTGELERIAVYRENITARALNLQDGLEECTLR